jgi:hypothetical protein
MINVGSRRHSRAAVCCADSRPAMTTLAIAPSLTTASSIDPRRERPILPIAIGRPSPASLSTSSKRGAKSTSATRRQCHNPHSL